jgi:glutathione reductase (NADPH)
MFRSYDVIVLGSGPSAGQVATRCATGGMRVAVVESRSLGGTCALRGCNPKKVLVDAADLVDRVRRMGGTLHRSAEVQIDWPGLHAFQEEFTAPVTPAAWKKYRELKVEVLEGEAKFTGPQQIEVNGRRLDAQDVVVATGAEPAPLGFPGADLVTTSDDFLKLESLPKRILFIGGGYISFEFAHVAMRAGVDVTIVHHGKRPLKNFEPGLVDQLVEFTRKEGASVRLETDIRSVRRTDQSLMVELNSPDGPRLQEFDLLVHGAGRVPAVNGLHLEVADVEFNERGIQVHDWLQSRSNPHVWAGGDVADTGQPPLTPVADRQGEVIARNLLEGKRETPEYGFVPSVVFTVPPLASIGMTPAQAKSAGLSFDVNEGDASTWGTVRKAGGALAGYCVLIEKGSRRTLGAHLLGLMAAETINLFAIAMKFRLTAEDLKSVLFAYPTFTSEIGRMLK